MKIVLPDGELLLLDIDGILLLIHEEFVKFVYDLPEFLGEKSCLLIFAIVYSQYASFFIITCAGVSIAF